MALVVYELIAVVFAIAAVVRDRGDHGDAIVLFAGWSWRPSRSGAFPPDAGPSTPSTSRCRSSCWGASASGKILHAIDWRNVWHGSGGLLALLMLGIVVGLAAVGVLLTRVDDQGGGPTAALPPVAVLCLVVVPLAYLIWRMTGDERREDRAARDNRS